MAQYIDKDALVAKINELLNLEEEVSYLDKNSFNSGRWKGLTIAKTILNTLEVKEVDSGLSLEDVSMLRQIMFDYNRQIRNEMAIPNDEDYCIEVLKRFKAQKGEEV